MRRCFVTGTDTDVGKTHVTAVLARAAGSRGTVLAAKPVASGGAHLGPGEDALRLAAAGGHAPLQFAGYRAPLSPHRAAALDGADLDVPGLLRWVNALRADTVLVEGAGGWRVPLAPGFDIADLAHAWGAPVLVVAADRLGVLNHTRLTVDAVRARGCAVAGVVLNRLNPDASSAWNEADLRACLDVPVAVLPSVDLTDERATIALGLAIWAQIG